MTVPFRMIRSMVADYRSSGRVRKSTGRERELHLSGSSEEAMNPGILSVAGAALVFSIGALAATPFTGLHPEEAHPDSTEQVSPSESSGLIKQLQQKLHQHGFDAGPVNGDFGAKTQAALAQFQLNQALPASGTLDDATMAALGLERETQAAAGASLVPASPEKKDAGR
jgi:D-Tyr-tRNAtyr deacylase